MKMFFKCICNKSKIVKIFILKSFEYCICFMYNRWQSSCYKIFKLLVIFFQLLAGDMWPPFRHGKEEKLALFTPDICRYAYLHIYMELLVNHLLGNITFP